MSSDKFAQMFEEAKTAGIDPDWISKFESAFEASPLREENKATKERMRELAESHTKLRDSLLAVKFAEHGVTIPPKALRLPDDLDPTNDESVEAWLVDAGLTTTKPTTDPATLSTHDRIAQASTDPVSPSSIPDISKMNEEEFWAAHAAGLLTPKK
jgi:hypothetical protein